MIAIAKNILMCSKACYSCERRHVHVIRWMIEKRVSDKTTAGGSIIDAGGAINHSESRRQVASSLASSFVVGAKLFSTFHDSALDQKGRS